MQRITQYILNTLTQSKAAIFANLHWVKTNKKAVFTYAFLTIFSVLFGFYVGLHLNSAVIMATRLLFAFIGFNIALTLVSKLSLDTKFIDILNLLKKTNFYRNHFMLHGRLRLLNYIVTSSLFDISTFIGRLVTFIVTRFVQINDKLNQDLQYLPHPVDPIGDDAKSIVQKAMTSRLNCALSDAEQVRVLDYFGYDLYRQSLLMLCIQKSGIEYIAGERLTLDHIRLALVMFVFPIESDLNNNRWVSFIQDFVRESDGDHPGASQLFKLFIHQNLSDPIVPKNPGDANQKHIPVDLKHNVFLRLKNLFVYHRRIQSVASLLGSLVILQSVRENFAHHIVSNEQNVALAKFLSCVDSLKAGQKYLENPLVRFGPADKDAFLLRYKNMESVNFLRSYADDYLIAHQLAYLNVYPDEEHQFKHWDLPLFDYQAKRLLNHKIYSVRKDNIVCHIAAPQDFIPGNPVIIKIFFPGTHCPQNIRTNTEISPGRETLNGLSKDILDQINFILDRYPIFENIGAQSSIHIQISGHSLGGALTMSLSVDLMKAIVMSRGALSEKGVQHDYLRINSFLAENTKSQPVLNVHASKILKAFRRDPHLSPNGCPTRLYEGPFTTYNNLVRISHIQATTCNSPGISIEEAHLSSALAICLQERNHDAGTQLFPRVNLTCKNIKVEKDPVARCGGAGHLFNYLPVHVARLEVIKFANNGFWLNPKTYLSAHCENVFNGLDMASFAVFSNGALPFKDVNHHVTRIVQNNPASVTHELTKDRELIQHPVCQKVIHGINGLAAALIDKPPSNGEKRRERHKIAGC